MTTSTSSQDEKMRFWYIVIGNIRHMNINNMDNIFRVHKNRNIEDVKDLVEKGADIETKDIYGDTPLLLAAFYRDINVVRFLVEKGANLECKDRYGNEFTYYLTIEEKEVINQIIYDIQSKKEMIKPCKRYPSNVYSQRGPPSGV